jgi:hypothetical protein
MALRKSVAALRPGATWEGGIEIEDANGVAIPIVDLQACTWAIEAHRPDDADDVVIRVTTVTVPQAGSVIWETTIPATLDPASYVVWVRATDTDSSVRDLASFNLTVLP